MERTFAGFRETSELFVQRGERRVVGRWPARTSRQYPFMAV